MQGATAGGWRRAARVRMLERGKTTTRWRDVTTEMDRWRERRLYTIELEVRRPPLPPGTATTPYELVAYLVAPTVAISKQYEARLSEDSSWPARPEARLCLRQVFGSPIDWAPQLPILPEVTMPT